MCPVSLLPFDFGAIHVNQTFQTYLPLSAAAATT